MLFFLLLLQTAPSDSDPVAEPAFPRILDMADCESGRRYRLDVRETAATGMRAPVLRGEWQPLSTKFRHNSPPSP